MIPTLAAEGLADAVDAFCERIAFTRDEIARVFDAARRAGLPVKLHADQLSNGGGAALAAKFGALSADHLEYADEAGVAAMAKAGVVAVLLPGAYYVLRERQAPPVALMRKHGVPMAVATDSNPGTSPHDFAPARAQHGGDAVRAHRRRMPRRRHAQCGARARPRAARPERSKPANGPISRSGTSSGRPSSSTGSGSIRCMRASGEADDRRPPRRARRRSATGARSGAASPSRSTRPIARAWRRALRRSSASSPAASPSMGSTPALASSRACASSRQILPSSSATSCFRTRPASASRPRSRRRGS